VAVDFDEVPFEAPSPRGKRSLMALSAVAILAVFITVYTMSSKSDGTASAEAPAPTKPQAVSALQPTAVMEHKAAPPPAPAPAAVKPPEPKAEAAVTKPMAAELAMNDTSSATTTPSRATNAPARYSPRSEYRRRSRSASAAERAEEAESDSSSEVATRAVSSRAASARAVPARPSAPAEEAAPASEVSSSAAAADDDADVAETPKSASRSSSTFNREAAKTALDEAAGQAKNCRPAGGPSGTGRVQVRYEPSGKVANVSILTSKFENTTAGSCVRMLFRRAKVPEFTGAPVVVVNKSFEIP
jgi:hypothetical protein